MYEYKQKSDSSAYLNFEFPNLKNVFSFSFQVYSVPDHMILQKSRNISYYYQCLKQLCCFIFL